MDQHDVREAIDRFLALLESGAGDESANIHALELVLDQLGWVAHGVEDTFDADAPDAPAREYRRWRALAGARFPSFGYYNVPVTITDNLMDSDLMLGDAIDDLADIACDLAQVRWCWMHTSVADALWHFSFGFQTHFGRHVRLLQWYVHAFQYERW